MHKRKNASIKGDFFSQSSITQCSGLATQWGGTRNIGMSNGDASILRRNGLRTHLTVFRRLIPIPEQIVSHPFTCSSLLLTCLLDFLAISTSGDYLCFRSSPRIHVPRSTILAYSFASHPRCLFYCNILWRIQH